MYDGMTELPREDEEYEVADEMHTLNLTMMVNTVATVISALASLVTIVYLLSKGI